MSAHGLDLGVAIQIPLIFGVGSVAGLCDILLYDQTASDWFLPVIYT